MKQLRISHRCVRQAAGLTFAVAVSWWGFRIDFNRGGAAMGRSAIAAEPQDQKARGGSVKVSGSLIDELVARSGEAQRTRVERGLRQVAALWTPADGGDDAFAAFVREHFVADPQLLDELFKRFEYALEQIDGHNNEIGRELRHWSELDVGPIIPIDRIFAAYEPAAHLTDDLFASKAAFVVLLNFPLTTLDERIKNGPNWSRRQWAEARLAQRFSKRVPAEVNQQITKASADGDAYIAEYNIWMYHLLDDNGNRVFPSGLRLISHWNLRDELKANYADKADGPAKQRVIAKVMERIVTQSIAATAINNPRVDWNPFSNAVRPAPSDSIEANAPLGDRRSPTADAQSPTASDPEPDTRYAHLLATFNAARLADPYSPTAPTLIARRFDENRELPEARVEKLLKEVLASPLVPRIAKLIEQRLGRKLEPFDIWYNGFQPRGKYTEQDLDAIVSKKYPDAAAFHGDMPRLLVGLGFTPMRATYLAQNIAVDPSRGAGHAMPAMRRGDKPRLRTRVEKSGMNYKGYNIAIHEMGHNVEQVFSLYHVH
jgi:hypothetical protein